MGGCLFPLARHFVPGAQDLVDEGLVAFALGAEPLEHVAVEPQRDDVLAWRQDEPRLVPLTSSGGASGSSATAWAMSASVMASRRA